MSEAQVSFAVSTVGLVIPFVLTEYTGTSDAYGTAMFAPISYAQSATVTWINPTGTERALTLTTPASAVYTYTISAFDYQAPRTELGRLRVSVGTTVFYTSAFLVRVFPRF